MKTTRSILRVVDEPAEVRGDAKSLDADEQMTTRMPRLALVPATEPAPAPTAPSSIPVADTRPGRSIAGRAFALMLLAGTLAGLGWLAQQIYFVVTDGWVAPLHLSPQNDQIQSLRLTHQRYLDELTRVDAEVARLDTELLAIDASITKLAALRGTSAETLKWQAEQNRVVASGLSSTKGLLRKQRDHVRALHARQVGLVTRARADLTAGLVDRGVVDREEQSRDRLALELIELQRQIDETTLRQDQTAVALRAYRAGIGDGAAPAIGRMPEIAAGDERDTRVEIELQRLEAEGRGHRALRAAAVASLARQRALLAEVEGRPLYRAMKAATDVAFIPYDQLPAVGPGAAVVACTWSIFACTRVGTVGEILPGEVVTEDPWGQRARGQYAVLELHDPEAIREKVLRVRR